MRPYQIDTLFAAVSVLAGIGPKLEALLTRLLLPSHAERGANVLDLLLHLPSGVIDRRQQPGIAHAIEETIVTLKVIVDRHRPAPPQGKAPYRIHVHDETGEAELVFFHARRDWLERALPVGELRYVSGRVERFNDRVQMVHPDHMVDEAGFQTMPLVEPIYGLTGGLSGKVLLKALQIALDRVPDMPEWQNGAWLESQRFADFKDCLRRMHGPVDPGDVDPVSPYWRRLAYDELLASQLALALMRHHMHRSSGVARQFNGATKTTILYSLPFSLTNSQLQAVSEIEADLASPERMLRLLQGDVGSGKTVVALAAIADVVEAGGQTALMAPTEILARQHFATIEPLAKAAGLNVAVLTGRDRSAHRKTVLAALADGSIDLLIGTHALFQAGVEFEALGLVVIDEQHRFGVHQRFALTGKGATPDVLVMTATPIPRTLVLAHFGDMDVSKLTEKPAGRQPIQTVTVSMSRLNDVVDRIGHALDSGAKAYWVCPLVEESEQSDLSAAEDRHTALKKIFGEQVGLIHGRMASAEKDAAMADFQAGKTRVLVATTVIEVGVDVPDATIMVIEHAERFGLAQLHQLRGRVGRGSAASSCVLLYRAPLSEMARARLDTLRQTEDGFEIAEQDLRLRGEGEVLGARQSGTPGFRIARLEHHTDLMEAARDDARLMLSTDPELQSDRGQALRYLLYLFKRDEAIRLLRAG